MWRPALRSSSGRHAFGAAVTAIPSAPLGALPSPAAWTGRAAPTAPGTGPPTAPLAEPEDTPVSPGLEPAPDVPAPEPALPEPALPEPALPVPALPVPALPEPALPVPAVPEPATAAAHVQPPMHTGSGLPAVPPRSSELDLALLELGLALTAPPAEPPVAPVPAPVSPPAVGPRVEFGFADGSTGTLDPSSSAARELSALVAELTRLTVSSAS